MPDYSKGKIYTIRCKNDATLIYVGSTIQPLSKRWGGHKADSKRRGCLLYLTINNDWDNWYVELYENYPCENKEQLCKREGEIIREIGTLNKQISGRTPQEYRRDFETKLKEKDIERNKRPERKLYYQTQEYKERRKLYRQANADKIKEQHKEYYQKKKLEKQVN